MYLYMYLYRFIDILLSTFLFQLIFKNLGTEEQKEYNCKKWLSVSEEDGDICRELADETAKGTFNYFSLILKW